MKNNEKKIKETKMETRKMQVRIVRKDRLFHDIVMEEVWPSEHDFFD